MEKKIKKVNMNIALSTVQTETNAFKQEVSSDQEEPPLIISDRTQKFRETNFPDSTDEDWNDWKWQVRNSITTFKELNALFYLSDDNIIKNKIDINLPLRITPYYASLINDEDPNVAIGRSVIPTNDELVVTEHEERDSLHEEDSSPTPCIVHRYPDRVLFLTTDFCASNCRYCTRSHMVSSTKINRKMWDKGIEYIKNHPEVRDVLLSGGDFFLLDDHSIEYLLSEIRKIEHVEFLRIGTKTVMVLPQRITMNLVNTLKKYHPLFLSIHATHPDELTPEVKQACERLADAGIPLGSQTVLLKGINDDIDTMKSLMHGLLKIRVRPYYLYNCDLTLGTSHFRTPISKGIEIIKGLRGFTSGYAVPTFVVDAPGGGGKIPILPDYYQGEQEDGSVLLKNYKDEIIVYYDK